MDFNNPKVYGDTSIADGLVIKWVSALAFWYVVNLSKNLSICIIVFAIVLGVGWFVFVRGIRAMGGGQSLLW